MLFFGLRDIKKCLFSYKAKTYLLAPLTNEQFSDKGFSAKHRNCRILRLKIPQPLTFLT